MTDKDAISKLNNGKNLATAGVYLQLGAFGLFTFIAVRFHFISRRFIGDVARRSQAALPGDKYVTLPGSNRKVDPRWERLLYSLNLACVMILVCAGPSSPSPGDDMTLTYRC